MSKGWKALIAAFDAAWEEGKHKRSHGQFASGSGGGGASGASAAKPAASKPSAKSSGASGGSAAFANRNGPPSNGHNAIGKHYAPVLAEHGHHPLAVRAAQATSGKELGQLAQEVSAAEHGRAGGGHRDKVWAAVNAFSGARNASPKQLLEVMQAHGIDPSGKPKTGQGAPMAPEPKTPADWEAARQKDPPGTMAKMRQHPNSHAIIQAWRKHTGLDK